MDEVICSAIKEFGLKSYRIVREKSYHICETNKGIKVIKKSSSTPDKIIFQNEIKEHLYQNDFLLTDRFTLTPSGRPYAELDDGIYVMTDLMDYKETDFGNITEFERTLDRCAVMHGILRETSFPCMVFKCESNYLNDIKKSRDELVSIKKQVTARKRLSDFDVMFFKNYNYAISNLDEAAAILEKNEYGKIRSEALAMNQICHNLLKEENLLQDNGNVYITNFSDALADSQLNDISSMIRRYIKNRKNVKPDIHDIIEIYGKGNPLDDRSVRIIFGLLKYPYNFIKLCGQFYSKKRTWTPNALINRMEVVVSGFSEYDEFIRPMERI